MAGRMFTPALLHNWRQGLAHQSLRATPCSALNRRRIRPQSTRAFSGHAENNSHARETKSMLLAASLPHVKEYGWTLQTLTRGADDLGLPQSVHGICSRGAADLVEYFLDDASQKLSDGLYGMDLESMGVGARVRTGVIARLKLTMPYAKQWPEALALSARDPQLAATLLHALARDCDEMWHHAGDTSADFNWYTKRATLAAIYSTTELFMAQDTSADFVETYSFLDNRLADLYAVTKAKDNMSSTIEAGLHIAQGLSQTALNMAGFNRWRR